MSEKLLYLDDLSVGDTFQSEPYEMATDEIIAFGKKYDPQPFHTDIEAAKDTFFKGLAASAWHLGAVLVHLVNESIPFPNHIGTGIENYNLPQATRPGDCLTLKSIITDIKFSKKSANRGTIYFDCTLTNQNDEIVVTMTIKELAYKKPA